MNGDFVLQHIGTALCLGGMVLLPFVALLIGFYLANRKANKNAHPSSNERHS